MASLKPNEVVQRFTDTFSKASEAGLERLEEVLDPQVRFVTGQQVTLDRAGTLAWFGTTRAVMFSRLIPQSTWSPLQSEDGRVRTSIVFPQAALIGGVAFTFTLGPDGMIQGIEEALSPPSPLPDQPVRLEGQIVDVINGALANGTPAVLGYVDAGGAPHLSHRGSLHVASPVKVAGWLRDPNGGLAQALPTNPAVSLWYFDPKDIARYEVAGRAHVETAGEEYEAAWQNEPQSERDHDPGKKGAALIIEVERVKGLNSDATRVSMSNTAG